MRFELLQNVYTELTSFLSRPVLRSSKWASVWGTWVKLKCEVVQVRMCAISGWVSFKICQLRGAVHDVYDRGEFSRLG